MRTKEILMYVLGGLIVLGFLSILGLFIFEAVPEGNSTLLTAATGVLFAAFNNVVNYFYGSSLGSARKTELMSGTNDKENGKPA